MREIKFKAWDKNTEDMCQVTRLMWNEGGGMCTEPLIKLTHISCNGVQMYHNSDTYELMQFTGLHDKNNREIYEGDIVKASAHDELCTVIWDKSLACYLSLPIWKSVDDVEDFDCALSDNQSLEIIGNIYENSELLEESNDTSESD